MNGSTSQGIMTILHPASALATATAMSAALLGVLGLTQDR